MSEGGEQVNQWVYTKHYTEGETIQWPKGQTMIYKTLHRRRDNTMAKRTNNDLQNIHIKLKIE